MISNTMIFSKYARKFFSPAIALAACLATGFSMQAAAVEEIHFLIPGGAGGG